MIHFPDHHGDWSDDAGDAGDVWGRPLTWELDNLELLTVGIDIGSSTSHLAFARLHVQRLTQSLSSRYAVAHRELLHRSPVRLTPYRRDGLIDVEELDRFIASTYRDAGLSTDEVDTGAVILTGTALEKPNSRAVADLFAQSQGHFVCASAGHNLEAILAAHGAGAVALSRDGSRPVLHLDMGGGTTKLALCRDGEVVETAALAVGARVQALDAAAMADAVVEAAGGGAPAGLMLTPPLRLPDPPAFTTCSGGVSEYVFGREQRRFGDHGPELAAELLRRFSFYSLPEGIRAGTYDGDTPSSHRSSLRRLAHIVLTNPDMLHVGILPSHELWSKFFKSLRLIVLDEMHVYRGVFGSHVCGVLRRLLRICEFYGSKPQFICCSATIANPRELAEMLTGREVATVERNGAPSGEKHS